MATDLSLGAFPGKAAAEVFVGGLTTFSGGMGPGPLGRIPRSLLCFGNADNENETAKKIIKDMLRIAVALLCSEFQSLRMKLLDCFKQATGTHSRHGKQPLPSSAFFSGEIGKCEVSLAELKNTDVRISARA